MNQVLTIAHKEIVDGMRDTRSVVASLFYVLMGPAVVGLVSIAVASKGDGRAAMLTSMIAIFTLVSAFIGGMNVAMDTVAGERERKSLLPLLLNAVSRGRIIFGKWIAISFFAIAGLMVNVAGFTVLLAMTGFHSHNFWNALVVGWSLVSLAMVAASLQLLISSASHTIKEAQTYLSLVAFVPMAIGMFMAFSSAGKHEWLNYIPVVGQEIQLQSLLSGQDIQLLQPIVAGYLSTMLAAILLMACTNRLQRDEILYGN